MNKLKWTILIIAVVIVLYNVAINLSNKWTGGTKDSDAISYEIGYRMGMMECLSAMSESTNQSINDLAKKILYMESSTDEQIKPIYNNWVTLRAKAGYNHIKELQKLLDANDNTKAANFELFNY